MKELKEGLLQTRNQYCSELVLVKCLWTHIRGFDPIHRSKGIKENRILFMIRRWMDEYDLSGVQIKRLW